MGTFDFRDMLGGADGKVDDPDVQEKITAIGEALLPALIFFARHYEASLGDVVASGMSHLALAVHKAGQPDRALDILRHVAKIAGTIERTIQEVEAERRG